jgi:hypothetical protein
VDDASAQANVAAFFRHGADAPAGCAAALIGSLSRLRGCDDPAVTFGRLATACVPDFSDGCQVELSDGAAPHFRVTHPASSAAVPRAKRDQMLCTPFRAVSAVGYPSYGGVVTHWWNRRKPSEADAVIAELMVRHVVALVDCERLMAAVALAEDRAASLALRAISGRTISLATGVVMHQNGLGADDAEDLIRQAAVMSGRCLHQVATGVVRSGSL